MQMNDDYICVTSRNQIVNTEEATYAIYAGLNAIRSFELRSAVMYINKADWDDIVKWKDE